MRFSVRICSGFSGTQAQSERVRDDEGRRVHGPATSLSSPSCFGGFESWPNLIPVGAQLCMWLTVVTSTRQSALLQCSLKI